MTTFFRFLFPLSKQEKTISNFPFLILASKLLCHKNILCSETFRCLIVQSSKCGCLTWSRISYPPIEYFMKFSFHFCFGPSNAARSHATLCNSIQNRVGVYLPQRMSFLVWFERNSLPPFRVISPLLPTEWSIKLKTNRLTKMHGLAAAVWKNLTTLMFCFLAVHLERSCRSKSLKVQFNALGWNFSRVAKSNGTEWILCFAYGTNFSLPVSKSALPRFTWFSISSQP